MKKLLLAVALVVLVLVGGCARDRTPPVVALIYPLDGDTVPRGVVQLKAFATDNKGVARVEFYCDTVLSGTVYRSAQDTFTYDWQNTGDSAWTRLEIRVTACDAAGNSQIDSARMVIGPGPGPTIHADDITSDEVWLAQGNPHIVGDSIQILNDATLTIQPGCIVKFSPGFGLDCERGAIVAAGKPDSLILFTSSWYAPAPGDWTGISVDARADSNTQFRWCTFEYGGSAGGELVLDLRACSLENCTIRLSSRRGISGWNGAGFSYFQNNTITQCDDYPIRMNATRIPDIGPNNHFTGNGVGNDVIEVTGDIRKNACWPEFEVPYYVSEYMGINGGVLTIEPGCMIQLEPGSGIGTYPGSSNGIIARGTPDKPITFTCRLPGESHWGGVWVGPRSNAELEFCTFEWAGSGWVPVLGLDSCSALVASCVIRNCRSNGIQVGPSAAFTRFDNNAVTACDSCPIRTTPAGVGSLGTGNTLTGNRVDAIMVDGGVVGTAMWLSQGVPYLITGDIRVRGDGSVLAIGDQTVLKFQRETGLYCDPPSSGVQARSIVGRITFTSAAADPAPGDWDGISIWEREQHGLSQLVNCNIEYAGGDAAEGTGNIYLNNALPEITGDSIRFSSDYGICLDGATYPDTTALRANNWFEGNPSGDIFHP